jgi:hypothetical protein
MQFVRATYIAVLGFALASGLYAQHGSGHAGGTGHAGSAGFHSASGVPRSASTPTSGLNIGGLPYPIRTDIPTPLGLNAPASAYTGILPGAYTSPINSYGYGRGNYGYGRSNYGYGRGNRFLPGFVASPLFFPTYWDTGFSDFPGYDNSVPPIDPNAQALADSQEALAQQIQQLSAEVQQMKNNQQPDLPAPAPAADAATDSHTHAPPVTLVLRDGKQITV